MVIILGEKLIDHVLQVNRKSGGIMRIQLVNAEKKMNCSYFLLYVVFSIAFKKKINCIIYIYIYIYIIYIFIIIIIVNNIISVYATQDGCSEDEKLKFWEELDDVLQSIPDKE